MFKQKSHISILLISLMLSPSLVNIVNTQFSQNFVNYLSFQSGSYIDRSDESFPRSINENRAIQTLNLMETVNSNIDTVIFVDDQPSYNFFIEKYQSEIIKKYDNLLAIKINIPFHDMKNQFDDKRIQMFPAQDFASFNIPYTEIQNYQNSIELSQTSEEAKLLGIDNLWASGYNGTNVNIAVMDNGIDFTHPALLNKIINSFDISTNDTIPCQEHGTPVAGLIVAGQNTNVPGTAYGSKLYDISFGCKGTTISGDILAGFDYILENNATIDVVNTSFGGFAPSWDFIIEKLESAGIVLVGSAGNDGPVFHSTTTGGPGNSIHGISIGSSNNNFKLSTFSARGPVNDMLYKPDLVAPGVNITSISNLGGYATYFGTSFSSPIVAGGVSSLISGLNSLGFNWNPGVIKAALLNTALNLTNNELLDGQGLVNFTKALDSIIASNIGLNNTPQLVTLTPKQGPIGYLSTIPQGITLDLPLTLISSHPDDVSISFTGDLNGISTHFSTKNTYSQKLEIQIDTSSITPGSTLNGNIIANLNGTTAISQIVINVGETIKGKIGIDLGHSYWDDIGANGIGSANTGEMIRLAMLNGFAVEHVNTIINDSILNEFDIFWMADPNNLLDNGSPSLRDQGFNENVLYSSEIEAIVNFVSTGGSLMIDFNGLFISSENPSESTGSNVTGINKLISNFGIQASVNSIVEPTGQVSVDIINQSSLAGRAEKYTHFGNYLELSDGASSIANTNGGQVTGAVYSNSSTGGRVLVTSSNYWLDNRGIIGGYLGAGSHNKVLAENSLNWLTQSKRIVKTYENASSNKISGSFTLINNKILSSETPDLYLEANRWVDFLSITPTDHGNGTYSFSESFSGEGIFRVIAVYGDDYVVWQKIVDSKGPVITPVISNPNGTILDQTTFYLIEFQVSDDISGVNENSITIHLDNIEIFPDITYRDDTGSMVILIRDNDIEGTINGRIFKLEITVLDKIGNQGHYAYYFQIGESITTSHTISSTSEQSSNQTDDDNFSNLFLENIDLVVFMGMVSIILLLTYKNYKLRMSRK